MTEINSKQLGQKKISYNNSELIYCTAIKNLCTISKDKKLTCENEIYYL